MPSPEPVCRRLVALVYDGTNAAAVVDHCNTHYSIDPSSWLAGLEDDEVLIVTSTDPGLWNPFQVVTGEHVVASTAGIEAVTDAVFTERFSAL
jgi:hypothetical protein